MSFQENLFKRIQEQANIDPEEIYSIADSLKHANFTDEHTVRNLVQQLSQIANKPISKEVEDKIVEAVTSNNIPNDLDDLM
ncbi:MAG TPA: stage VI sporulation protein F [Bacillota bacterium]|nr:stage VI sporulation protein F [Bacillota bacterium]